ncbi:MAG: hypothetical protein GX442_22655 [Candidatus Riflebacteria bacterium]|nr:hypothetical protein [Candidatus Riflebacteria bacterium]
MFEAIRAGDTERVRTLLAEGIDPNGRTRDRFAVDFSLWHDLLLRAWDHDMGIGLYEYSHWGGFSPLMAAASHRRDPIVDLLLEAGADLAATDSIGLGALMYALVAKREAVALRFLERGAPVAVATHVSKTEEPSSRGNENTVTGLTPLHVASLTGSAEVIRQLLERGADPSATDSLGRTPMQMVLQNPSPEARAVLVGRTSGAALPTLAPGEALRLLDQYLAGDGTPEERIRSLIPRVLADDYYDAYHRETNLGGKRMELFEYACARRLGRAFRFLVETGQVPLPSSPRDETPFQTACRALAWDIADFLLERGFRPGPADLMDALPNPPLVGILLERGVPVTPCERYGQPQDPVRALLEVKGSDHGVITANQVAVIDLLADHGARLDLPDQHGNTPLIIAVKQCAAAVVQALARRGAPLDGANARGQTALMTAAFYGHDASAKALIEAGAPLDQRNQVGQTALWMAVNYSRPEQVRLLLQAGADRTIPDAAGITPLALARQRKLAQILPLLG